MQVWSVCLSVFTLVDRAEMDEPSEMPFRDQTQVGAWNNVFYGIHMDATWRIHLNDLCWVAMQAAATINVATCCLTG